MEYKYVRENIDNFNKRFEKEEFDFSIDECYKTFFVKNFFYGYDNDYLESDFYEIVLLISNSVLKNALVEVEHYVNMQPSTALSNIDYEIISKKKKDYQRYNLVMYKFYREFAQINLNNEHNTVKVVGYVNRLYAFVSEYQEFAKNINQETLDLIDEKIKELEEKIDEKDSVDSSIFY